MFQIFLKYKLLIFILFASCSMILGQERLTTSRFLATAKNQTAVALQEQKIDALSALSFKLPFVERIDFQTETDRFQWQRQEVRSRVSFNGWDEMRSLKQQKEANMGLQQADRAVLFKNILLDRYALLVEYRFAQSELAMYRQLQEVFSEKRDVLQKMAKLSTNFNIEDLIKAEDAAFDYQQRILESEGTIRKINQFFSLTLKTTDSLRLDTTNWIPLSMLHSLVTDLPSSAEKNPNLTQQAAKIDLIQSDYNLEKAKTKKVIDYGQIRNSARNKDAIIREWSVGVGFLIPYRGSSKIELNQIAFKQLAEKNELTNLQTSLDLQIFSVKQDLDLIFKAYDFVQKQVNESQTLYSLDHYSKVQGSSPIILLRMQELVLGRQVRLISLEHTAFQKYIKLLDLTGKLAELPLKNYLLADLSGF